MARNDLRNIVAALSVVCALGCASSPSGPRIDNVPMYGQPQIQRPEAWRVADESFIRDAAAGFGGDREAASKAWWIEGERFMYERNLDFAMRRYNQAWLLAPNSCRFYWGFGRVLLEQDKVADAIQHLEKANELCRDLRERVAILADTGTAYSYRALSLSSGKTVERDRAFALANERFAESTKLDPTYGKGWLRWSQSLYREGKLEDARAKAAP